MQVVLVSGLSGSGKSIALAVLEDAVCAPAFKSATFALERDAQVAALQQDADDVVTFARKLARRKFFGQHPLALDARIAALIAR